MLSINGCDNITLKTIMLLFANCKSCTQVVDSSWIHKLQSECWFYAMSMISAKSIVNLHLDTGPGVDHVNHASL